MILISQKRYNGAWIPGRSILCSLQEAALSLVRFELNFGGRVTNIAPREIVVQTPLGLYGKTVDITVFKSPWTTEIDYLVRLARSRGRA